MLSKFKIRYSNAYFICLLHKFKSLFVTCFNSIIIIVHNINNNKIVYKLALLYICVVSPRSVCLVSFLCAASYFSLRFNMKYNIL